MSGLGGVWRGRFRYDVAGTALFGKFGFGRVWCCLARPGMAGGDRCGDARSGMAMQG